MGPHDLDRYHVSDETVRTLVNAGRLPEARTAVERHLEALRVALAEPAPPAGVLERLAGTLCDLAAVELGAGHLARAVETINQALAAVPDSQLAFHNLVSVLMQAGQLRGGNYGSARRLLQDRLDRAPWAGAYRRLLHQPTFLNVQFVAGKCNLKCRMCVGTNAESHPGRLTYIDVERFEQLLAAAPTIDGLTLSSGDSDPLLHPRFGEILESARRHTVRLNIYTNGHPLGERLAAALVESRTVSAINFSIDAASEATYKRIRGAVLAPLVEKIERLQAIKRAAAAEWPVVALSFVAMADNVHELPEFVSMAARLGATRVFTGDLIGWLGERHGNHPATDEPRCFEYVEEAKRRAEQAGIDLSLPERLASGVVTADSTLTAGTAPASAGTVADPVEMPATVTGADTGSNTAPERLTCCGWLNGVWVQGDGSLQPCCLVSGVADMGSVDDGPLLQNDRYAAVKAVLAEGKVFETCAEQRMCEYVQQQATDGVPLRFITGEDLGPLLIEPEPRERVPLTVRGA